MTTAPSAPSREVLADDHRFAAWCATQAGTMLQQLRRSGLEGKELKDAGDRESQLLLADLLARHRPDDAVLSEEARDDPARLESDRVWIVDPVDGTREFSEPPREDWAIHVALWAHGRLAAGAVAQPGLGHTFATDQTYPAADRGAGPLRLAVSRSRPPSFVTELAEHVGAELVPMGSAGVKVISVVRGLTDAYLHAGGQYEWDSAAPVAVARAAGLFTSRIDGSELLYNQRDVWLPDLVVCRPELADSLLDLAGRFRTA